MTGRTSLATPTDVYPANGDCVVLAERPSDNTLLLKLSFTNNCDSLSYAKYIFYDATTNEVICTVTTKNLRHDTSSTTLAALKGDTLTTFLNVGTPSDPLFISGRHYKYKIRLYATRVDEDNQSLEEPDCCVPYASGKIRYMNAPLGIVDIQENLTKLQNPEYIDPDTEDEKLLSCTYIRIGNEQRMIENYDAKSGRVTAASAFSNDVLSHNTMQYYLNCNYIETGYYDFCIREDMQVKLSAAPTFAGLRCKAAYSHPNNVGVEKYRFQIYEPSNLAYISGHLPGTPVDAGDINIGDNLAVNTSFIYLEKGHEDPIQRKYPFVGAIICIERSVGQFGDDSIVTSGFKSLISGYNPETGFIALKERPTYGFTANSKYTIYTGDEKLLADSGDLYGNALSAEFPLFTQGKQFHIYANVTSYEKQTEEYSYNYYVTKPTGDCPFSDITHSIDTDNQFVHFEFKSSFYEDALSEPALLTQRKDTKLFRRNKSDKVWSLVGRETGYLKKDADSSGSYHYEINDYTAANNTEYEYILAPSTYETQYDSDMDEDGLPIYSANMNYLASEIITASTKWDCWTISSLLTKDSDITHYMDTSKFTNTSGNTIPAGSKKLKNTFTIGQTWHFISAIDPGNISHNLGLVTHVGTSAFPTVTRTDNAYESGSFSANLLTLECPSEKIYDDIDKVNKWIKFINGDNLFLLKSDKGDVWVIAISENVSRTYDESTPWVLTSVTYDWVEAMKTDDILIET